MTNYRKAGSIATLVTGGVLSLGSIAIMVHDGFTNGNGDGWNPANGVVSKVLGVERGYECSFSYEIPEDGWMCDFLPDVRYRNDSRWKSFSRDGNPPARGIKRYVSIPDSPWLELIAGLSLLAANSSKKKEE